MEVLALKQMEKTSNRDGKNWLWNPLKIISLDHSVPQHLQRVHTKTLELTSPLTYSHKNNTRNTLACQGRTSTPSSHKNSSQTRTHKFASLNTKMNTW